MSDNLLYDIDTPVLSYFCDHGDPQWDEAWGFVREEFGDDFDKPADIGECWRYMGTFMLPDMVWRHEFRHRDFLGSRLYRRYPSALPPVESSEIEGQ